MSQRSCCAREDVDDSRIMSLSEIFSWPLEANSVHYSNRILPVLSLELESLALEGSFMARSERFNRLSTIEEQSEGTTPVSFGSQHSEGLEDEIQQSTRRDDFHCSTSNCQVPCLDERSAQTTTIPESMPARVVLKPPESCLKSASLPIHPVERPAEATTSARAIPVKTTTKPLLIPNSTRKTVLDKSGETRTRAGKVILEDCTRAELMSMWPTLTLSLDYDEKQRGSLRFCSQQRRNQRFIHPSQQHSPVEIPPLYCNQWQRTALIPRRPTFVTLSSKPDETPETPESLE